MVLQPIVTVFVFEIDRQQKRAAGEGNGVWKFADNVVKLDPCGDRPGAAKGGLALAKPENRIRIPEGGQIHLGYGGDECLGTFWNLLIGGGGASLPVYFFLCF
jgi:hypothetical protein